MLLRLDRVRGTLLGLAAGDRIGGPIRMALQLGESLLALGRFDANNVGARYLAWWRSGGFDTGLTARRVFDLVGTGVSFTDAAAQTHIEAKGLTAGCNPTHRSAALAMLAAIPDEALADAAISEARLTHVHPLAGDVSAAAVVLRRALIRGLPWQEALHVAKRGRLDETVAALSPGGFRWRAGGYSPDTWQRRSISCRNTMISQPP